MKVNRAVEELEKALYHIYEAQRYIKGNDQSAKVDLDRIAEKLTEVKDKLE